MGLAQRNVSELAQRVRDLKSGRVKVLPLELDSPDFVFTSADSDTETCSAYDSSRLSCTKEKNKSVTTMIAAVALQQGTKYLLACVDGDSTCFRPKYGYATVAVEGRTVQFLEWNVATSDRKTGRTIDSAPAFFTVLTRVDATTLPQQIANTPAHNPAPDTKPVLVLPKSWVSTMSTVETTIRVDGDYLYEQSSLRQDLNSVEGSCETKRKDKEWVGECNYYLTLDFPYRTTPLICNVRTSEIITSVSPTRIEGKSQRIDMSRVTPNVCPVPGSGWIEFALIPK
jgi:hypothetical protein